MLRDNGVSPRRSRPYEESPRSSKPTYVYPLRSIDQNAESPKTSGLAKRYHYVCNPLPYTPPPPLRSPLAALAATPDTPRTPLTDDDEDSFAREEARLPASARKLRRSMLDVDALMASRTPPRRRAAKPRVPVFAAVSPLSPLASPTTAPRAKPAAIRSAPVEIDGQPRRDVELVFLPTSRGPRPQPEVSFFLGTCACFGAPGQISCDAPPTPPKTAFVDLDDDSDAGLSDDDSDSGH